MSSIIAAGKLSPQHIGILEEWDKLFTQYSTVEMGNLESLKAIPPKNWEGLLPLLENKDAINIFFNSISRHFWAVQEKYARFLDIIEHHHYQVMSLRDLKKTSATKKIAVLYHDTHAWDILPAIILLAENRRRNMTSTFFINWRFAPEDHESTPAYLCLCKLAKYCNCEIGLHSSPLSSWIRSSCFKNDPIEFENWCQSDNFEKDLTSIILGNGKTSFGQLSGDKWKENAKQLAYSQATSLQEHVSDLQHTNPHGDEIGRFLFHLNKQKNDPLIRSFFAGPFYQKEILDYCNLEDSILTFQSERQEFVQHLWEPTYIHDPKKSLKAELANGKIKLILNHPRKIYLDKLGL
ncbi:MAG: hypothetical protein MI743_12455 [Sneathiellales bacterium]|nr:hypothetical protein [Sneathiellales bacterium]